MVGDGDQPPGRHGRVDRAARVRQHEAADPEAPEDARPEDDALRRMPLVEVRPALHHGDADAAEAPEHEHAGVPERGRHGPARNVLVGDLDRVLDRVRESAETRAEHHADLRGLGRARPDRLDGRVVLAHVDPSSRRSLIIRTTESTASAGSSVR